MTKYQKAIIILIALACLISGFVSGIYVGKSRGIPFVKIQRKWSIGIYVGHSPYSLASPGGIRNPVLTAKDVTDIFAEFVADPFMIKENKTFYMFFEVMNAYSNQGDIGLATSNDGLHWVYKQIVLDEPFHLSYPCVFKWNGEYFMIPESHQAYSIRLYKSIMFPTRWVLVRTLLCGRDYVDATIFRHGEKWWIFAGADSRRTSNLYLYYSEDLMGPWLEHPESPIIKEDVHKARPGGRVIVFDGRIIRYAQDSYPIYGSKVRALEIDTLTTEAYKEHEVQDSPILLGSGKGWNADGMHQVDPIEIDKSRWIACVDGYRKGWFFSLRY